MVILSPRLTWGLWDPFPNGRLLHGIFSWGPAPHYLHPVGACNPPRISRFTDHPSSFTDRKLPVKSSPQVGLAEAPMRRNYVHFQRKQLSWLCTSQLVDRCVSANLPNLWSQWVSSSFWGIHLFHLWVIIWIFTTWSLQPHNFLESSEARCSSVACQKPTQLFV